MPVLSTGYRPLASCPAQRLERSDFVLCPITDLGSAREATARLGGYLPLAPGVSTVRYPIPERIFDYVSTVRSATAG